MSKLMNFSNDALSRDEMKAVSGGAVCTELGTTTDPAGYCHKVYSCRHSILGIPYGKQYAKFVKQSPDVCFSAPK